MLYKNTITILKSENDAKLDYSRVHCMANGFVFLQVFFLGEKKETGSFVNYHKLSRTSDSFHTLKVAFFSECCLKYHQFRFLICSDLISLVCLHILRIMSQQSRPL